jgi:hypothetical protein
LKYIFVAGAPGSKWSSVVKNIYYSPNIDRSDYSDERTYYHDASGTMQLMHMGAYFDPGMEFGDMFEDMYLYTKEDLEKEFDKPFSGDGVRIIKSHVFSHNVEFLKKHWPECPVILVHRDNDACLGWWVRCGHFNITYPKYDKYYKDLRTMSLEIDRQNKDILYAWDAKLGTLPFAEVPRMYGGLIVYNNIEACNMLQINPPPMQYRQRYDKDNIRVKII